MKDGRPRSIMQEPEGWPGNLWLEGATLVHLPAEQPRPEPRPRGPAKRIGPGFLNPAMAPARTRSVMLLADALEHDWLVPEGAPIRVLDALCSTGVRIRRWRQELPEAHIGRVVLTETTWTRTPWTGPWLPLRPIQADDRPPPDPSTDSGRQPRGIEGVHFTQEDARVALLRGGWQWVDLDPFGSPMPFLDAALQGMARRGVLEVTATDTAALTGSSAASGRRRYGFHGMVDHYAHDDAVRVLLANVALAAARQDRNHAAHGPFRRPSRSGFGDGPHLQERGERRARAHRLAHPRTRRALSLRSASDARGNRARKRPDVDRSPLACKDRRSNDRRASTRNHASKGRHA